MSYNPINWQNDKIGGTKVNATNLNIMDKGIADAHDMLADHDNKINDFANEQIPEEYLQQAVDNYIAENQAGLALKAETEALDVKIDEVDYRLSSEIELLQTSIYDVIQLNGNYLQDKAMDNGITTDADGWLLYDDYVEIEPSNIYSILGVIQGGIIINYYDDTKTYTGRCANEYEEDNFFTFRTPLNARYMVISVYKNKNLCLVRGSVEKNGNSNKIGNFPYCINFESDKPMLSDVNNAEDNTIYRIQLIDTVINNMPLDYPYDKQEVFYLFTISNKFESGIVKTQHLISYDFQIHYYRDFFNEWSQWDKRDETKKIITCGVGKDFTKLRDAIAKGCELGCKVIVYPGTYNLLDEFPNVQANHDSSGIALYGGVYVEFLAGSYVKAIFDNSDRWIYDNFEPFYSVGDFTLDGLNIEVANTRYCVHDEHGGVGTQHHIYKNCVMKYTNEHDDINYVQCIGGGLGEHGYIEIDGGYYESKTTVGLTPLNLSADDSQHPISYHNGNNPNCDSKIIIKNVYLADKGYLRFGMYGSSQIKSKVYVSGCSMYKPIWNMYENSDYNVENFEIIEFNNTIRNVE